MNVIRRNFPTVPSREVVAAWSDTEKIFFWYVYEFGELALSGDAESLVILAERLGNMVEWELSTQTIKLLVEDALASCNPKVKAAMQGVALV